MLNRKPVSITKPTGFPNLPVDFAGFSVGFLAKRGLWQEIEDDLKILIFLHDLS
jgi:hypothetical protein